MAEPTPEERGNNKDYTTGYDMGRNAGFIHREVIDLLISNDDDCYAKGFHQGEEDRREYGRQDEGTASTPCFLTTACVVSRGLPDNCIELRTLRRFRDKVLLDSPEGRKAVSEYYEIAPKIVVNVNALPDDERTSTWNRVYTQVARAVALVHQHRFKEAFQAYKNMTLSLKS
jgi:hypothetical protein